MVFSFGAAAEARLFAPETEVADARLPMGAPPLRDANEPLRS